MAEVDTHMSETRKGITKRKFRQNKSSKLKKRAKTFPGPKEKVRIDGKMRKLFRKRAEEYNSDDDESVPEVGEDNIKPPLDHKEDSYGNSSGEEGQNGSDAGEEKGASEDEGGEIQPGITKFIEGCRAFRIAFKKIAEKNVSDDSLGPVLSGHKKLVVEKLTEEAAEHKVKGEAKKEKHLVGEKGHVKPANFLDSHEKFLIGVATKGVVKLFNAVNKAQNAQKGLNPSSFKDAKALGKRRRQAFFSELHKAPSQPDDTSAKGSKSLGPDDDAGPSWAPLRDGYMLTSSKLKNWDKMADTHVAADEMGGMPLDSSSDDD